MLVAGAAALAVGVLPATAGAAKDRGRSCHSRHSKTVFHEHGVRVFKKRAHRRTQFYGCVRGQGHKWHLTSRPRHSRHYRFTLPTLTGPYLAFAERHYGRHGATRISVVDMRTGKVRFRTHKTRGHGSGRAWRTTALVVTRTGDAAWIDRYRFDDAVTEVRAHDSDGDAVLDRGRIHARYLKVDGQTVTWAKQDGTLSATLR